MMNFIRQLCYSKVDLSVWANYNGGIDNPYRREREKMMKRWLSAVLCLLMLLTLVGCGQDRIPKAKTVTKHGVECYQVDHVQYPAVFGIKIPPVFYW